MNNEQWTEYLFWNGQSVSKELPLISGKDRGFLTGEGLFETLLVRQKPLFLKQHLHRLQKSAIQLGYKEMDWETLAQQLWDWASLDSGRLRITLSAGNQEGSPFAPISGPSQILASLSPYTPSVPKFIQVQTLLQSRSWIHRHKSTSLAETCYLARQKGENYEFLLVDPTHQWILEGLSHNFFFFQKKTLCTPALELPILPGITRAFLLRLWEDRIQEGSFCQNVEMECPFLCNSLIGIVPIHQINGQKTNGSDSSAFERLQKRYQEFVSESASASSFC
ncbi:MAG: aminotransferase class IV [Planctomycetota bacterium]